jgi:5,10-methylenetetrahydromethanopterin reductase
MTLRLGLSVGERGSLQEIVDQAIWCEEHGFESIWVGEGRLFRDAIVPTALIASRTERIRVGPGVLNNKTRNAALIAVTFKTLAELAPGRIHLGLGAWWEPLATSVGTPVVKPIKAMREYITVISGLFGGDTVSFEGEFATVRDVRFDMFTMGDHAVEPVDVPIYVGAVGPRMLELAGECADGVLLDFLVPPSYISAAVERVQNGIANRTDGRTQVDLPQLVACSIDEDDPQAAIDACKAYLVMYLTQQPHITEHSGIDPELIARLKHLVVWPASRAELAPAIALISNELVQNVAACGTTDDALAQIGRYTDAGSTSAVLCTVGDEARTLGYVGHLAGAML